MKGFDVPPRVMKDGKAEAFKTSGCTPRLLKGWAGKELRVLFCLISAPTPPPLFCNSFPFCVVVVAAFCIGRLPPSLAIAARGVGCVPKFIDCAV